MSNFKSVVVGGDPLASDVNQYQMAFSNQADVGALQLVGQQATPATPTGGASGNAGNLNGAYLWKTVLVTGWKQSDGSYYVSGFAPSGDSASVTITNNSASLTAIATGSAGTIARAIYRTVAGGAAGTEKYVGIIWDNVTTTFTDNVADANLGTGMPTSSTTPAAYAVAIPANVPAANTTGTTLSLGSLTATSFLLNTLTNQSTNGMTLQAPNGTRMSFLPSASVGNYNNLVQADDSVIMYGKNASGNSAGLSIVPWSSTTGGFRMDGIGNGLLGGRLVLGGTNNINNPAYSIYLAPPNATAMGLDGYGDLLPISPSSIPSNGGAVWQMFDKNGLAVLKARVDGGQTVAGAFGNLLQAVSGGFKVQSGITSPVNANANWTVTFPTAFNTAPQAVFVMPYIGQTSIYSTVTVIATTTTTFSFYSNNTNSIQYMWFAIGT